jgi:excisionase family DNA binding protein
VLPNPVERPTVHVEEAGELLGISRGSAYDAVANGEIPSIRIGRRIVVPTAALLRLLAVEESDPRPAA